MAEPSTVDGRVQRIVYWLIAHRLVVFVLAFVLTLVAGYRTFRTYSALSSDLEELLPASAPSVLALKEARTRLSGVRHLGIVVDTAGPQNLAAAQRFLDALAKRIRGYPPELVRLVRQSSRPEHDFVDTYLLQLMDPADVRRLAQTAEQGGSPGAKLESLRATYEQRLGVERHRDPDRFVSSDGHTLVLLVQTGSAKADYQLDRRLLELVQRDVVDLGFPSRFGANLRVGYAGDVATRVEETAGLESDLTLSALVVGLLSVAVVYGFYRSWWSLPVVGLPLLCATLCSFAVVALPPLSIRSLNSNTAFLGSIVTGNGINSGIMLLARLQEEQQRGAEVLDAIVTAVRETWRTTLAAAVGAGTAYASLIFTDFRGFNQFGWIGGLGLLICWAAAYLVIPPFVFTLSKLRPGPVPVLGTRSRLGSASSISSRIGRFVRGRSKMVVALALLSAVALCIGIFERQTGFIEYDLGKLRRRDSAINGERYWGKRMDVAVGRYLTPTVCMSQGEDEARAIESRWLQLKAAGRAGGLIGSVISASTWLPPGRAQSLKEAERLRAALTPSLRAALPRADRDRLDRVLSPRSLRPLEPRDIPEVLLTGLRETNGRIDRNVLLFPKLGGMNWNAQKLEQFSTDVREGASVNGVSRPVAGALLLSADIAHTMKSDGPRAILISLAAVIMTCLLAFQTRRRSGSDVGRAERRSGLALSAAAMASLLTGVLLMLGTLSASGAKLNFCNFVALPITFGIAADYSINMLRRYQLEQRLSFGQALSNTSGAVALCSATTIIGFGSLLMAQNQALFSFGLFAIVGEITCLATAVLALPAALSLLWGSGRAEAPPPRTAASAYRSSPQGSHRPAR